jgi:hypothetical protein
LNTSQLLSILDTAGMDPRDYRVLRDGTDDGLYLLHEEGRWTIFWSERGGRSDVEHYDSEDEACVTFLRRIMRLNKMAAERGWRQPEVAHQDPIDDEIGMLVARWCDRRDFRSLRTILGGWPRASGLTDEWGQLMEALQSLRADGHLPMDERTTIERLVVEFERIVYRP